MKLKLGNNPNAVTVTGTAVATKKRRRSRPKSKPQFKRVDLETGPISWGDFGPELECLAKYGYSREYLQDDLTQEVFYELGEDFIRGYLERLLDNSKDDAEMEARNQSRSNQSDLPRES